MGERKLDEDPGHLASSLILPQKSCVTLVMSPNLSEAHWEKARTKHVYATKS